MVTNVGKMLRSRPVLSLMVLAICVVALCVQLVCLLAIFFGESLENILADFLYPEIVSADVASFVFSYGWSGLIVLSNLINLVAAAFIAWQGDVNRKMRVFWMISFIWVGLVASVLVCATQIFLETRFLISRYRAKRASKNRHTL